MLGETKWSEESIKYLWKFFLRQNDNKQLIIPQYFQKTVQICKICRK